MTVESATDLAGLRRAGRAARDALRAMRAAVAPGVTTRELDAVAERTLAAHGARSAPRLMYGFPGAACISVNEEIVHGVPGPRALRPGDVVKLDVTAECGGFVADTAVTVFVPPAPAVARRLRRCVRRAFRCAVEAARAGRPVREIGRAVEREVGRHGFYVLRELSGHGVGRKVHEPPCVPNFDDPFASAPLVPGAVLALEPLVAARRARVVEADDGWTLRTDPPVLAAHHEHTIVVRDGRPPLLITA